MVCGAESLWLESGMDGASCSGENRDRYEAKLPSARSVTFTTGLRQRSQLAGRDLSGRKLLDGRDRRDPDRKHGPSPVRSDSENLWFRANGLAYCLHFPGRLSGRIPNLTVNGHTKIAIEGRRVHVLDDDGKDWKLTIVAKVAPKQ